MSTRCLAPIAHRICNPLYKSVCLSNIVHSVGQYIKWPASECLSGVRLCRGNARFLELGGPGRVAEATRGWGVGRGCPLPSRGRGLCPLCPSAENFWTFAFKMVHFGAFWKALLTEQCHPPPDDFTIYSVRQQQQTPFRGQEAQYTIRKYCWNTNAIQNWTLVTSSYGVTVRTSVQSW